MSSKGKTVGASAPGIASPRDDDPEPSSEEDDGLKTDGPDTGTSCFLRELLFYNTLMTFLSLLYICKEATWSLLNHMAQQDFKVSLSKLQFCEAENMEVLSVLFLPRNTVLGCVPVHIYRKPSTLWLPASLRVCGLLLLVH
ncbi:hypothetical protein QTP86_002710 [Hemibagrus guttatus]|nr:hypothetical protein QTP86_002710 [Hemibagrus guttatus]